MKVPINQFMKKASIEFAKDCYETNKEKYIERKQKDPDTIKSQISLGRLGELGVCGVLYRQLNIVSRPDFKIYPPGEKSFLPDLNFKNLAIHVKSCDRFSKFPPSWTFQFDGKGWGHTDPIIKNPKENKYVAFCIVDDASIEVVSILSALLLKNKNLYEDPKLPHLKGIKKCIYLSNVIKLSEEERWSFVTQAAKLSS